MITRWRFEKSWHVSRLRFSEVVHWPRRGQVERPHERVPHTALVCRMVLNERLHVALERYRVGLQGCPQDTLGAG